MKNPRFEDDALGTMRQPDEKKIACKDCVWREPDRLNGKINGATLALCRVYTMKPDGILWNNDECPYYVDDSED